MTNTQTISWIFLAIAIASSTKTADINAITDNADGINHAIPTQDELQNSISFLTNKAFVIKEGYGYKLTTSGSLA